MGNNLGVCGLTKCKKYHKWNGDMHFVACCRNTNSIRSFILPSGEFDIGLVEAQDYVNMVNSCQAKAKQQGETSAPYIFDWFIQDVLSRCIASTICEEDLLQYLTSPLGCVIAQYCLYIADKSSSRWASWLCHVLHRTTSR